MNQKLTKGISILLAAGMLGVLGTGCGSTPSNPQGSGAAPQSTAPEAPSAAAPAPASDAIEFIVATNTSEDSVNHLLVAKFKELMEERSEGKVVVSLYENGQLGGDREMTEGVIAGNIDFIIGMTGSLVDFIPACAIFDTPNVFPDVETARKVLDGELLTHMQDAYAQAGLKLFSYADSGFREMTSNKAINSVADFSGLKIRVTENKNHISYWEKLGANPTPMDFGEVYIGLQQGTIDAMECPYDLIVSNKMYEPQTHIIETNHLLHTLNMVMNLNRFETLPEDMQKLVNDCAVEAHEYARKMADERIESRKKIITDAGKEIIVLPDEVIAQMIEKVSAINEEIKGQVGQELVDLLISEVQKAQQG